MSSTTASTAISREVTDYAIENQCFHNHHGAPYRFRDIVKQLRETAEPAKANGLIDQPGLTAAPLPLTKITLEPFLDDESYEIPIDPKVPASSVFRFLGQTKSPRLPSESIDTGHDLQKELSQYRQDIQIASSCNILTQWLPLSYVSVEKDEGLGFPSTISRWQTLALRELEGDEPSFTESDHDSLYTQQTPNQACTPDQIRQIFSLDKHYRSNLEPVSPPLSPASDLGEPFLPSREHMVIDLTSEPSSPSNPVVEDLDWNMQHGFVDSEPPAPSTMPSSPPTAKAAFLSNKAKKHSALKLDTPILPSSTVTSPVQGNLAETLPPHFLHPNEAPQPPTEDGGYFEEALQSILDEKHHQANQRLEQDRLNPVDTLFRLRVPAVDFQTPNTEWLSHFSTSRGHFEWLQHSLPRDFHLTCYKDLSRLEASLKWTPIPHESGQVSLTEAAIQLGPAAREMLTLRRPQLCSRNYVVSRNLLIVLQILNDEEIEQEVASVMASSPLICHGNQDSSTAISQSQKPHVAPSLKELIGSLRKGTGNKSVCERENLLLEATDLSASSSLLSGFMQLRQPKRLKKGSGSSQTSVASRAMPSMADPTTLPIIHEEAQSELQDAPVPNVEIPQEACRYIVSLDLSRSTLSYLEKVWPQAELIDRDFSQYNTVAWSPGLAQRREIISSLAFEADISMSPGAGLILTTILKVKQKPLPGSSALTPFRERVRRVSEKYESLFVLVSESNPLGEYVGSPTPSDISGYADFVRFTTSLGAGISTHLVSGCDETLSKWALSIMSRYSTSAHQFGPFLDFRDGAWELFLRRAGLNISAAQIIAGLLVCEYGQGGLASFLSMRAEERVSKYGQIMGGRRILNNVSRILDREWV
ncbi:uncharacterized protein FFB20_11330 [Fusarium fujikuroi]|uniref:Uncharacterized protein n=1 Tax=Fusarium fujikuroi TaxID=5127 RepID=A0A2H3S9H7_FUSFU|nr:uncharacterized protein Y057_5415 [Fusarium fujikuroi]QGI60226.1 hypothetical protein CEK27_004197 [Fusarium fujikuroi]QGI91132.1 hypothetical protein CEK26_004201 [Fusarium fujikuroi]SCN89706.1 uncharacterized protein FFE2_06772 [Fusarium fujikuroi]SCO00954.1 uncharacterized protein FFB20_11330 [Fusarium fujikuroi]